jgi:5-methylthioadenosine/S-adenosylhomocysteine deaminase
LPKLNVVSKLVSHTPGADLDTVIIDGRGVIEGRRLSTIDEEEVLTRLQVHVEQLWRRTAT